MRNMLLALALSILALSFAWARPSGIHSQEDTCRRYGEQCTCMNTGWTGICTQDGRDLPVYCHCNNPPTRAQLTYACNLGYGDPGNQAVCLKRCLTSAPNCVRDAAAVINACANLFTAQTNINYCKDHCAAVPPGQIGDCRMHAAEMINTGRREPYVPSRLYNACSAGFGSAPDAEYCQDHCRRAPLEQLDQCVRHAAEMINIDRRQEPFAPNLFQ